MAQTTLSKVSGWRVQYNDLIRSFAGAFLFGVPFIYSIEMWWIATYLEMWKLFFFLAVAAGINIVLGYLVFLDEDTPWYVAAAEALFNFAVGTVGAALVLFLLGRFRLDDPLREILGKLLLQAIPLSIGAAVTHRVARSQAIRGQRAEPLAARRPIGWKLISTQVGITAAGALFLSLPLSSTEEITVLASGTTAWRALAVVLLSLLVVAMTIYRNRLGPSPAGDPGESVLPMATDTLMTYSVSLLVGTLTLYLFDRIDFGDPLIHVVRQIVVLGLPGAVGGAAGRRLL